MRQRHTARVQRPHGLTPSTRTRSHTDTLAQTHARAPQCDRPRGHTDKPRSECEPRGFHTQEVRTPLDDNHAPSGWLFDRGSGLRTRLWYQDVAARTSPLGSIHGVGFMRPYVNSIGQSVLEQISCLSFVCKSFFGRVLSYIVWGCLLGLTSAEQIR